MTSLTLDGSTRIIGTEFIKLEVTGSSNLATEAFVLANAGSGGGGTGTTDLTNYYNKTQTDNLLLNKLNKDNPQDMTGTLRLGHIAGTSKIILNAVSSTKDFYVSGDAEINGNILATSIDSNSFIQGSNLIASGEVKTNTIDSNGISDITFKRNTFDICYLKNNSLELNSGIDLVAPAQVQANTYNSFDDSSTLYLRNGDEFMRFRKTEDDILISKNIVATDLTINNIFTTSLHGDFCYADSFRCRYYNADTPFLGANLTQDGRITFMTYRHLLEDVRFLRNIYIDDTYKIQSNIYDSSGNNDMVFKRNDVNMVSLTATDFITENDIHLVSQGQVKSNIFNSYGDNNTSFRRYGTEYLIFNSNPAPIVIPCVEIPTGIGFTTEKFFCDEYRSKNDNVNILYWGGNSAGNGKVKYMSWKRTTEEFDFHRDVNVDTGYKLITDTLSSPNATNLTIERGGVNYMTLTSDRISIANSVLLAGDVITGSSIHGDMVYADSFRCRNYNVDTPFLGANVAETGRITFMTYRHLTEDIRYLRSITVDDTYKISSNIYDSSTNADVYFKRNNIDYMQLGGVALRTRMLTGCQSDIYDSLGNSDVSYRRNGIDFFYLRNGKVELNTGIGLKTDEIDTIGDTNLVIKQNGGAILTYDVGDVSYPNGIFKFDKDVSINTANYLQCNTIKAHIFDTHNSLEPNDVSFRYDGTTYMFYDSSLSNFQVRTDIVSNQDIQCVALTETSDKRLKEDIDDFHSNCSEIIKKINVKKYKFKDDKKKKTNIGFIADEVLENTPSDIENIVDTKNDYLSMNYGRMCCLLWKALQEEIDKREHLESRLFEVENFIKDYIKAKPKAKAKSKTEK